MTLLHEMAHIKIGYFYNNKCFYKRTPDKICDRNIKECGFQLEASIYGGIINYKKIDADVATIINNSKNYSNICKITIKIFFVII